jgi:hypothetical protein
MALRVALVVVALMAASGAARSVPQGPPLPLTSSGWVEASTSADGSETVVSLDVSTPGVAADGLVDMAFRLQHAGARHVQFAGSGTVTFQRGLLTITRADGPTWAFAIASRTSVLPAPYKIVGLSHHWGAAVKLSHPEVAAELLSSGCAEQDSLGCAECQLGGPGSSGCTIGCDGDSACSADCTDGYFACCTCPGSCRCCPPRER